MVIYSDESDRTPESERNSKRKGKGKKERETCTMYWAESSLKVGFGFLMFNGPVSEGKRKTK